MSHIRFADFLFKSFNHFLELQLGFAIMIKSLQSLRGIFAFMIYLHHVSLNGHSALLAGGDCGVAFFIMLSGFVLSAGYYDKVLQPDFSLRKFMYKRFIKLYPLHLAGFMLWLLLLTSLETIPVKPCISNLMLIQSWIPSSDYYFSCNAVSWCLSSLLFCYALFPFCVRAISGWSKNGLITVLLFLMGLYGVLLAKIPDNLLTYGLYICPALRMLDFCIGILLFRGYLHLQNLSEKSRFSHSHNLATTVQISLILLIALAFGLYNYVPERFALASYWWIPCACVILGFAFFDGQHTGVGSILKSKPLLWFGEISFDFYIVHQLAIRYWTQFSEEYNLQSDSLTVLILMAAGSIGVSWLLHETVSFLTQTSFKKLLWKTI